MARTVTLTVGSLPGAAVMTPGLAWLVPADINTHAVKVFPHYFTPYPVSTDDAVPQAVSPYTLTDSYARVWNDPNSTYTDEHAHAMSNHGGYFRGRPQPRTPIGAGFKVADCVTDILQAQAMGWDGFFVELLGLSGGNYDNSLSLLAAVAQQVPGGSFKLIPQIDANGATGASTDYVAVAAYLKQFYDGPSRFTLSNGNFVVSTFLHEGQTPAHWASVATQMQSAYGITVSWFACFNDMGSAGTYSAVAAAGFWGKGSNPGILTSLSPTDMTNTRARGQKWMPPVWCQDVRPRSQLADETLGFGALIEGWKAVINQAADYILAPTWSDFSEGSAFNVSVHAGWCNLDISSYFIIRLKTGSYPAILDDVVYLAHRNQFWDATLSQMTAAIQTTRMAWWDRGAGGTGKRDIVDVLTFLTAPADVTVTAGGVDTTWTAPAGMFEVNTTALRAGAVSVVVKRAGVTIAAVASTVPVTLTPITDDLEYWKFSSLRGTAGQYSSTNQVPTYGPTRPS